MMEMALSDFLLKSKDADVIEFLAMRKAFEEQQSNADVLRERVNEILRKYKTQKP